MPGTWTPAVAMDHIGEVLRREGASRAFLITAQVVYACAGLEVFLASCFNLAAAV